MKVKLSDILNANEGLKLAKDKELPVKLSYWLARLQVKLEKPIKAYETSRMELFKKYGTLDEEKKLYTISAEKMEDFNKEIISLVELEEEITFEPITLEYFDGTEFSKEFFILMNQFVA